MPLTESKRFLTELIKKSLKFTALLQEVLHKRENIFPEPLDVRSKLADAGHLNVDMLCR